MGVPGARVLWGGCECDGGGGDVDVKRRRQNCEKGKAEGNRKEEKRVTTMLQLFCSKNGKHMKWLAREVATDSRQSIWETAMDGIGRIRSKKGARHGAAWGIHYTGIRDRPPPPPLNILLCSRIKSGRKHRRLCW